MPSEVSFIIPMKPVGKDRPRVGGDIVYTPTKTAAYENYVKFCYLEQCGGYSFGSRSIQLFVTAYVLPLSTFNKSEVKMALDGILKPTAKPDADNILKLVLDALNELAYDDDRYIYKIVIERVYSEYPRLDITIADPS